MDHHCKWLNCCIGESNYRYFLSLVGLSFVGLLWYTYIAAQVVYMSFERKDIFVAHVARMVGRTPSSSETQVVQQSLVQWLYLFMAIADSITVFSIVGLIGITRLLIFHLRLNYLNMTTVEFISLPNTLYDDEDAEYSDFESGDNPWQKPWTYHRKKSSRIARWTRRWIRSCRHLTRRIFPTDVPRHHTPSSPQQKHAWSKKIWMSCLGSAHEKRYRRKDYARVSVAGASTEVPLEMLATRTIRPTSEFEISLSDPSNEQLSEDGMDPEMDLEMDLDLALKMGMGSGISILKQEPRKKENSLSKLSKLLDLSEEEALWYQENTRPP
ncbi:hypothetical protein BDF14DRAFT_1548110 [Spinellus fusiger]|nr:hypothetical protein BDF14DRAFT_1548110 [Spinellus fusiger]